jgi:hypothetical protein
LPDFAEKPERERERAGDPAVDSFWYQATLSLVMSLVMEQGVTKTSDLLAKVEAAARHGFSNRVMGKSVRGISRASAVELLDELRQIYSLTTTGQRPGAENPRCICTQCYRFDTDEPRSKYCESPLAPQMPHGMNPHSYALVQSEAGIDALARRAEAARGAAALSAAERAWTVWQLRNAALSSLGDVSVDGSGQLTCKWLGAEMSLTASDSIALARAILERSADWMAVERSDVHDLEQALERLVCSEGHDR